MSRFPETSRGGFALYRLGNTLPPPPPARSPLRLFGGNAIIGHGVDNRGFQACPVLMRVDRFNGDTGLSNSACTRQK